jgi:ribonuclease P protein component
MRRTIEPQSTAPDIDAPSAKRRGRSWTTLKRRADFLRVAATGLRRTTPAFILQAATAEPGTAGRVGFTVSKKVGNSVMRNRAKRRLRALVDRVLADGAQPAFDYVVIGRGEALTRDFAVMAEDLRQAFARIARERNRR